jgi:hypothetical protein
MSVDASVMSATRQVKRQHAHSSKTTLIQDRQSFNKKRQTNGSEEKEEERKREPRRE